MAAAEGIELTAEEAEKYFEFLNSEGVLSDDELENVAGGKGREAKYKPGQRVIFEGRYGTIESSWWVEFQEAFYYWVVMDDGERLKFPLESPISAAKVIG